MIGTDRDWRTVAATDYRSFALKTNGTIWAWGQDLRSNNLVPKQIAPGTNWMAISAHGFTFLALRDDGTIWLNGLIAHIIAPALVPIATENLTQIGQDTDWTEGYAESGSFFARKKDGSWWVCGKNYNGQLGLSTNIAAVPSPQRLAFNFEAWAFAPGNGTTLMLGKDGKLWTWGQRLGVGKPSTARRKFEAFVAPAVKRFPSLGFLIKSDIDQTPHLLWELPAEVRRSLGTGPKISTNNLITSPSANASRD
jgi:alpha-tubulin suppressor-like RCC1 family protein